MTIQDGYYAFDNDLNSILAALNNCYVISGMAVAEDAPLDMGVVVAAGTYYANGTKVVKGSETDMPLDASDPSLARKDLIVGDSTGVISFVKGTNAVVRPSTDTGPETYSPVPPNIPADKALLAEVWIGAGVNSINNASITARGVIRSFPSSMMPVLNVKDYGAKGDNSTDDTAAILAAIQSGYDNGGAIVHFPALGFGAMDRYKTTEPILRKDGVSLLGDNPMASRTSFHGSTGDCSHVLGIVGSYPTHFFVKNLGLGFEGYYDNTDAKVIKFTSPEPSQYIMENVILRYGYYGLYDTTSAFQALLKRVWTYDNRYGFYKVGGGAYHFDACYTRGRANVAWDIAGWYLKGAHSSKLTMCALDNYIGDAVSLAHFEDMEQFAVAGFSVESNTQKNVSHVLILIKNCPQTGFDGILSVSNTLDVGNGSSPAYGMVIKDSKVSMRDCRLDSITLLNSNRTGYGLGIDDSEVSIVASNIPNISGSGGTPTLRAIDLLED